jgi:hypothetical protein
VTITAYAVGCLLGGATTGLVLGALGSALPALPALVLGGLACLLAAAVDLAPRRRPVGRRQVDEDWLGRYRGWVYGVGFGYQLGLGVVTVVTSAATFALLGLALLSQSAALGLLLGAVFGGARALPALALRDVRTHDDVRAVARLVERRAALAHRSTVAALAVGGVVLLAGGVG